MKLLVVKVFFSHAWKCTLSGVKYRNNFWHLKRKPAVTFSKWLFFQNSLVVPWPIWSEKMQVKEVLKFWIFFNHRSYIYFCQFFKSTVFSMKAYLLTNIRRWTKIKNLQIRALCTWDIWEGHKNSPHLSVFFAIKCSFRSVKLLVENRPNFCSLFRIHIWTLKRIQVWWVFLQYWKECFVNCLIGTWDHWDLRPLRPDVRILILRNMLSCYGGFRLRTVFFIQVHLCTLCVSHLQ